MQGGNSKCIRRGNVSLSGRGEALPTPPQPGILIIGDGWMDGHEAFQTRASSWGLNYATLRTQMQSRQAGEPTKIRENVA